MDVEEEECLVKEKDKAACRTRSLSNDFKQYLAQQGLQVPSDTSSMEVSSQLCSHQKCLKVLVRFKVCR